MTVIQKILFILLISFLFITQSSNANTLVGKVHLTEPDGTKIQDASNIVVFLEGGNLNKIERPLLQKSSMSSKDKIFVPKILVVVKNSKVIFPNEDDILHNVFSRSVVKIFDLGLYPKGVDKTILFNNTGLVKVYCNIHEKMIGYILILENPFYSITDKQGNFSIPDIPNGKYNVRVWHRFGRPISKKVTLNGKKTLRKSDNKKFIGKDIIINMLQTNSFIGHKNKWGRPYKEKY